MAGLRAEQRFTTLGHVRTALPANTSFFTWQQRRLFPDPTYTLLYFQVASYAFYVDISRIGPLIRRCCSVEVVVQISCERDCHILFLKFAVLQLAMSKEKDIVKMLSELKDELREKLKTEMKTLRVTLEREMRRGTREIRVDLPGLKTGMDFTNEVFEEM